MKVLIGLDIVPTEATEQFFIDGDIKTLFGGVCSLVENADRTIINLFKSMLGCSPTDYRKWERGTNG